MFNFDPINVGFLLLLAGCVAAAAIWFYFVEKRRHIRHVIDTAKQEDKFR